MTNRRSRIERAGWLVLAAGALACSPTPGDRAGPAAMPGGNPLANERPMRPVTPGTRRGPERVTLLVQLTIYSVEVPFGTVSQTERLWRFLDEEIARPDTIAALHRNGMRLGRGRREEWPVVAALLQQLAGQAPSKAQDISLPGADKTISLKEHLGEQRIFTLTAHGRLDARDYPPGDNVLALHCLLNDQDLSQVILHGVPAVRTAKTAIQWERAQTGYRRVERRLELPLAALEFTVTAAPGQYLVLGPGVAVATRLSPGYHFLVNERDGLRYESLLVLVPEVFAAPG